MVDKGQFVALGKSRIAFSVSTDMRDFRLSKLSRFVLGENEATTSSAALAVPCKYSISSSASV